MRENYTKKKCVSCAGKSQQYRTRKNAGFLMGFLLVVLPKCPLCVIAYSSTIMLCSKEQTVITSQVQSSLLATGITLFFCMIIMITIYLNYKDARTKFALVLSLIGSVCVISSTIATVGPALYYIGTGIIFASIWLNGSLFNVLYSIKNYWQKWQVDHIQLLPKNNL